MDPDSIRTRSSRGAHACYNAQIVVDEKNGLIIDSEISQKPNDVELFAEQMDAAIDCIGVSPKNVVADAGYHNIKELKNISEKGISVIVPTKESGDRHHREGFVLQ